LSSILKALKKLEKEAKNQRPVRLWRQNNHGKHTDENVRFRLRNFIILVGLIIAVGAGVFLNQNVRERKSNPIPQNETRFQKSDRLPEKKAVLSGNIQKESPIEKNVKKPESIRKTAPVFSSKPPENADVLVTREFSKPERLREETMVDPPVEKPVEKTTIDRFASLPVKQSNETKIELQAIAWSSNPKNRLTVINGLILREGESIDNAIVMHIGKDEIILRKEGVQWKQLFGF